MELRDYLAIMRTRWRTVLAAVVLSILVALGYSLVTPATYTADASVFLSVSVGQSSGQLARGFAYAQSLATMYSRVATQPIVLGPVIEDLGLKTTAAELAGHIVARAPQDTVIIQIRVTDEDPKLAARVADAVAKELSSTVVVLSPKSIADSTNPAAQADSAPVHLTMVSPALVPTQRATPRLTLNLTLALIIGLAVGGSAALLQHAVTARINRREVSRVTETPVIAVLDTGMNTSRLRLFVNRRLSPGDPRDQIVQLRTNFEHLRAQRDLHSVVFTSAVDDEATSWVVSGLADSLSQTGAGVLLVDADLRHPSLATRYGVQDAEGLRAVLTGRNSWNAAVQKLGDRLPDLLPAGPPLEDPSVMLSEDILRRFLKEALDSYEIILVKTPAVRRVAEGILLSKRVDGVVLVADEPSVGREALSEAVEALELVRANTVAVVLTR
jgi:succinoglycan biosynthesis transport protein ExoP